MLVFVRAAVALALLFTAAPASANVIFVGSQGRISGSVDELGLFGAAGSSLDGLAYDLKLHFQPTGLSFGPDGGHHGLYGGWSIDPNSGSPAMIGFLTISGVTVNMLGDEYGSLTICGACTTEGWFVDETTTVTTKLETFVVINHNDYSTAPYLWAQADVACSPEILCSGQFGFEETTLATGALKITFGTFVPDYVVVSSAPEPQTWALLIVGLGLSGAAIRRRRHAV